MMTKARKRQGRRQGWSRRTSCVLLSKALEGREDLNVRKGGKVDRRLRWGSIAGNVIVNRNFISVLVRGDDEKGLIVQSRTQGV